MKGERRRPFRFRARPKWGARPPGLTARPGSATERRAAVTTSFERSGQGWDRAAGRLSLGGGPGWRILRRITHKLFPPKKKRPPEVPAAYVVDFR